MKIALLQLCSSNVISENKSKIELLLRQAKQENATLAVLPENFAQMQNSSDEKLKIQERLNNGPIQNWLSQLSKELGIWIIAGSFPISSDDELKPYSRCLVYNRNGQLETYYDKIHMFDVMVSGNEEYCESADTSSGIEPKIVSIDGFNVGLSICYDLRFPELYRWYQQNDVDLIVVPSAFTQRTGELHWSLLLQARAVENLCYIAGVNQTGIHSNGRSTYGHSQFISPWGKVMSSLEQEEGILIETISKNEMSSIRKKFPAHQHRKMN